MDIKLVNKYKRIKDISERRKAFVEDLINFYNRNNRSYSTQRRSCLYAPAHSKTPGCAIGRCLPVKLARRLDKFTCCALDIKTVARQRNITLPTWLIEMGVDFLAACQSLHDTDEFWNEIGLNVLGRQYYESRVKNLI